MSLNESWRFVAVLNKKIETGKLMNALAHMAAGMGGGFGSVHDMRFLAYRDKDGGAHPHISYHPFIVLKADNSNQIRKIRNEALARNISFNDFTSTMTVGTSEEQIERTKNTAEVDLEYWGICLFGKTEELREFTGKFSLFQ